MKKRTTIHFYSENGYSFNNFYKKLYTLLSDKKRGKVRIMQIGGSHIQAEIWPDQVRMDFLDLC